MPHRKQAALHRSSWAHKTLDPSQQDQDYPCFRQSLSFQKASYMPEDDCQAPVFQSRRSNKNQSNLHICHLKRCCQGIRQPAQAVECSLDQQSPQFLQPDSRPSSSCGTTQAEVKSTGRLFPCRCFGCLGLLDLCDE